MFKKVIDGILDRMQTQDFWRGVVYVLSAVGVTISPENGAVIISTALAISGVIHTIWHKQVGTDVSNKN